MRIPSNQVTINGHRGLKGWSVVDIQALVEAAVVISSGDATEAPWVTFTAFNWQVTLHGDAAVAFQEGDEMEPGRDKQTPVATKSLELLDHLETLANRLGSCFSPPPPPVFVIPETGIDALISEFADASGGTAPYEVRVRAGILAVLKKMGYEQRNLGPVEVPAHPRDPSDTSAAD